MNRRYARREAQNRSFEKKWAKANEAIVTASVRGGESLTGKLRLLNNKIQVDKSHKLNQFLKQCFIRNINFYIAVKTSKLRSEDFTFNLTIYNFCDWHVLGTTRSFVIFTMRFRKMCLWHSMLKKTGRQAMQSIKVENTPMNHH